MSVEKIEPLAAANGPGTQNTPSVNKNYSSEVKKLSFSESEIRRLEEIPDFPTEPDRANRIFEIYIAGIEEKGKRGDPLWDFICDNGNPELRTISKEAPSDKETILAICFEAYKRTAKKRGKSEEKNDGQIKRKAHFERNGKLYLEILTKGEEYKYAYLNGNCEPELTDTVDEIFPVELLKTREGDLAYIVKMPNEGILRAKLLSATELLEKLEKHIKKYCDLGELDIELCCYYALFTWFYKRINTVGYLRFIADTGKGKSRMIDVIGDLCFYPISSAGSSSFSGMMRYKEYWNGTLIIDEGDISADKENQNIKYLNLGFQRGKYFLLSDKQDPKRQEVFDPFGPKIIGMREPFRDNATEGRLLSITPYETRNEKIPIILNAGYYKETEDLRNEIAYFVLAHWQDVDGERMLSFRGLGIEPRLQQLAMPLSIIFQLWPEGKERFKHYIISRQSELKRARAQSWHGSMFNYVLALANNEENVKQEYPSFYDPNGEIQAITPRMVASQFNTSAKTATETLASIGFEVEHRWIVVHKETKDDEGGSYFEPANKKKTRCYVVPAERTWQEMVQRYYYDDEDEQKKNGTDGTDVQANNDSLKIPDILKSRKYVGVLSPVPSVPSVPENDEDHDFGTDGTDGTLHKTRDRAIVTPSLKKSILDFLKLYPENSAKETLIESISHEAGCKQEDALVAIDELLCENELYEYEDMNKGNVYVKVVGGRKNV